jgi:hypothetical protein
MKRNASGSGFRDILIYGADFKCSQSVANIVGRLDMTVCRM